jgi:tRNA(fMet)-specific endonuclease VapC
MSVSGSYLLDTNVVIAFFSGEPSVVDRFNTADEILLTTTVAGELFFGAQKSARKTENIARVESLIDRVIVLDCNTDTARRYGEIKNALRIKGKPIPDNDIWIAAMAMQYGLTLATRDAHFAEVAKLEMETW